MRLAMAQMSMKNNMNDNYKKSLTFIEKAAGSDILLFPELQLTPFFPQISNLNVKNALSKENDARLSGIAYQARKYHMHIIPSVYLEKYGLAYNAALWYDKEGQLLDIAKQVHILDTENVFEKEYFQPSDTGFVVKNTTYGKVGVVMGMDRHFPESIRTCALKGADLILIPAANTRQENTEMITAEIRVQAMQNGVFIAMCSRVGKEINMQFCGESLVVSPAGEIILKADEKEQLVSVNIDLKEAAAVRERFPYLQNRRKEKYGEQ
ncbi:MAG: carbon-nitrogen hydrolase family protein [Solobacterium sp.]|nr:carbon-nitrogen hydrolase family protein [Solobacterium sp.]